MGAGTDGVGNCGTGTWGTAGTDGTDGTAGSEGVGRACAPALTAAPTSAATAATSTPLRPTRLMTVNYPAPCRFSQLLTASSPGNLRNRLRFHLQSEGVAIPRRSVTAAACAIAALALASTAAAQAPEPVVTLKLRAAGASVGDETRVAIAGTFRGPAVAGRRSYVLRPVGVVIATHRHGSAAAQRARIERVVVDRGSGSRFLRIFATGSLVGGPAIGGPGGPCRYVAVRHVVRVEARTAVLRWACRRAAPDRGPALHRDVFTRPGDAMATSYTLVRRPCSTEPAAVLGRRPGLRAIAAC